MTWQKRLAALLLTALVLVSGLPTTHGEAAAAPENTEDARAFTAEAIEALAPSYPYDDDGGSSWADVRFTLEGVTTGFQYNDSMLLANAQTLSTDLVKASVALSAAAYRKGTIEDVLWDMGFDGGDWDDYSSYDAIGDMSMDDYDRVAYTIARKTYVDPEDGATYTIYCVPVMGTRRDAAWFGNFNLGDPHGGNSFHAGFYKPAETIYSTLKGLFRNDGATPETRLVWLTGHSRGAAVANIVGGKLMDDGTYVSGSHMFCYTFACPAVGLETQLHGYTNIVNFNNGGDLVPLLPLKKWGYGRYGVTITNKGLQEDKNFKRRFAQEMGKDYHAGRDEQGWRAVLESILPNESDYPDFRTVLDLLAYFVLGGNQSPNVSFDDFLDYMVSEHGASLAKTGLEAQMSFVGATPINAVVIARRASIEVLLTEALALKNELEKAQDEDEVQELLSENQAVARRLEQETGVEVTDLQTLNQAIDEIESLSDELAALVTKIGHFLKLWDDSDGNLLDIIDHGHNWKTYLVWINEDYFGFKGWYGSTETAIPLTGAGHGVCTTIGESCFEGAAIRAIDLPASVRVVGRRAFYGCEDVQALTIPNTLLEKHEAAFGGCTGILEVTIPVEHSVCDDAFQDTCNVQTVHYTAMDTGVLCDRKSASSGNDLSNKTLEYHSRAALSNVDFAEGVVHIGAEAFSTIYGSNAFALTHVTLPSTLKSIGNGAFAGNAQWNEKLVLPEGLSWLGSGCFSNCGQLTGLELPSTLKAIPMNCFNGCAGLTELTIPDTVESADVSAFAWCTSLESVTMPAALDLHRNAFSHSSNVKTLRYTAHPGDNATLPDVNRTLQYRDSCEALETLVLDDGIAVIDDIPTDTQYYFGGQLKEVDLPDSLIYIGSRAFKGQTALEAIELPAGLKGLGANTFFGCSMLKAIELPESVASIDYGCFSGCGALESIELPANMWEVSNSTFSQCTSLKSVKLPEGIQQIHYSAFKGCEALEEIELPSGLVTMGMGVFEGCTALKHIELPPKVNAIAYNTFYGCSMLESAILPASVESVGSDAFYDCGSLKRVEFRGAAPQIDYNAFLLVTADAYYDPELEGWTDDTLQDYGGKLTWKPMSADVPAVSDFILPESLTAIEPYAFQGIAAVAVRIPEGCRSIGAGAFKDCKDLKQIIIPGTVLTIHDTAFDGCGILTVYGTEPSAAKDFCDSHANCNFVPDARD